ncbi:MAG: glycosyltransferase family 2 protein [Blastochloris sp.]|nr:glycosyltransferase family 2 protein [Blastochloris sp.]
MIAISVIVPCHNPNQTRLHTTLNALSKQDLSSSLWELLVVDNASIPALTAAILPAYPVQARLLHEPRMGLTFARRRGMTEARGTIWVFVDDDNELDPSYLRHALAIMTSLPQLGATGGKSQPCFESPPQAWQEEFLIFWHCAILALMSFWQRVYINRDNPRRNIRFAHRSEREWCYAPQPPRFG